MTVAEIQRRVMDSMRDLLGARIEEEAKLITVEPDPVIPGRINYTFPCHWQDVIHAEFVEYDEPIGCRR